MIHLAGAVAAAWCDIPCSRVDCHLMCSNQVVRFTARTHCTHSDIVLHAGHDDTASAKISQNSPVDHASEHQAMKVKPLFMSSHSRTLLCSSRGAVPCYSNNSATRTGPHFIKLAAAVYHLPVGCGTTDMYGNTTAGTPQRSVERQYSV